MATPREIVRLFEQVRDVTSPVQRVKLLARGWKSLRRMDRSQIRMLASQLGFEGAEDLLSRLARGRGIDVRLVTQALRRAQDADPSEVKEFIAALGDPERQAQLLSQGAQLVVDQIDPEVDEPAEPQAPVAATLKTSPGDEKPAIETTPPPPPPPTTPQPARPEPRMAPVVEAPPPAPTDPPPVRVQSPPARRPAPRKVVVEAARQPGGATPLIELLLEERSPIVRFRVLANGIEDLRGEDVERLHDLLECFPAGWQRRRALAKLLHRRIPGELHRAVFLIERLEDPFAERWCASVVLDRWDLEPHERDAIAERHALRLRRASGEKASG